MSKREIYVGGRSGFMEIIYVDPDDDLIIAKTDDGKEYICRHRMGAWCAYDIFELISALKAYRDEVGSYGKHFTEDWVV